MAEEKSQDGQWKSKKLISPSQVAGGALASVTAAYLGSHLGVAGTFWGAGLTSVIMSVGGAVYQRSLERTKEKATLTAAKTALTRAKRQSVTIALRPFERNADAGATSDAPLSTEDLDRLRQARSRPDILPVTVDPERQVTVKIHPVPNAVRPGMHWPNGEHVVDDPRAEGHSEPTVRIEREDTPSDAEEPSQESAPSTATKLVAEGPLPSRASQRIRWGVVVVTSVLVFVVCVLLVTGFEAITGKPLSGGQRGTSLGQMFHPNPPAAPAPSVQPATTTAQQQSSQDSEPSATMSPSQQPSIEPTSQTPRPPSQPLDSQQPAPTTSPPSATAPSTTAPQASESATLLPGQ